MQMLVTKDAEKWLLGHAVDGREHGWRCKGTGTEIRFVKVETLVHTPATPEGLRGLTELQKVYYPQCTTCRNELAIGEPTRSIDQQTLAEASILI